jgi:hypothetical protein
MMHHAGHSRAPHRKARGPVPSGGIGERQLTVQCVWGLIGLSPRLDGTHARRSGPAGIKPSATERNSRDRGAARRQLDADARYVLDHARPES